MGTKVKAGDRVIWKEDLEEYGTVKSIDRLTGYAKVICWDSEAGEEFIKEVPLDRLEKVEEE